MVGRLVQNKASWCCLLVALWALAGVAEAAEAASAGGFSHNRYRPRVRKELRSLTTAEWNAYVVAMSTLLTVTTAPGRRIWGPRYISYPELIMKHCVATNDPRGDQGHNGPSFMTFHRALLLELENSMLAVQPALKALPYWDITLDNPGAKYYGTPKAIFSEKYAGFNDGNPAVENGVTTGVFAWRQVGKFIPAQWPQWLSICNGSAEGLNRGPTNTNPGALITRYPTQNLVDAVLAAEQGDNSFLPFATLPDVEFPTEWIVNSNGQLNLNYPPQQYIRCLNARTYSSWMEWNFCVDFTVLNNAPDNVNKTKYAGPQTGSTCALHAAPHWTTGGLDIAEQTSLGDMFDVSTSPNEPLMFAIHHANLDRSATLWQTNAAKLDPAMPAKFWRYPTNKVLPYPAGYPTAPDGTLLNDVLNSNAPFTNIFNVPPRNPQGYTHREVLYHTRPGSSPYIYDTQVPTFIGK